MVASVSSPAAGERNLSVEGFERNRVNNQTRTTSKLLFLPPVCARNLHVLFMSRSLPRFTVSAIYGRSSFSSYYRWHLSTLSALPPSPSTSGVRRSIHFAASSRRRPSLNLILTDQRRRVQRWSIRRQMARKLDTTSLHLAIFPKDPPSSPSFTQRVQVCFLTNTMGYKYDFLSDRIIFRIRVVRVL